MSVLALTHKNPCRPEPTITQMTTTLTHKTSLEALWKGIHQEKEERDSFKTSWKSSTQTTTIPTDITWDLVTHFDSTTVENQGLLKLKYSPYRYCINTIKPFDALVFLDSFLQCWVSLFLSSVLLRAIWKAKMEAALCFMLCRAPLCLWVCAVKVQAAVKLLTLTHFPVNHAAICWCYIHHCSLSSSWYHKL